MAKDKIIAIEWMRVVAAVAIVTIHVVAASYWEIDKLGYRTWIISAGIGWMLTWSIPIFIMISGYLILGRGKTVNATSFYQRRLVKIGIPWLFWNGVYFIINGGQEWGVFVSDILNNGSSYHLYFVNIIIGLYLVTPILDRYLRYLNRGWVVMALTGMAAIYHLGYCFWGWLKLENILVMWLPYTGYYLAGYWLGKRKFKLSGWLGWGLAGGILAICVFVTRKLVFIFETHDQDTILVSRLSLNVAAATMLIFNSVLNWNNQIFSRYKWVTKISELTLGIYLIHPLWLRIITEQKTVSQLMLDAYWLWFSLVLLSVLFLSSLSVWAIKRVPLLRSVV